MIAIDESRSHVHVDGANGRVTLPTAYADAFEAISKAWLRCGWDTKHRKAIKEHFLHPYIHLIEASSIAPEIVAQATGLVRPGETVVVMLDSKHTRAHVLAELRAYAPLLTPGSYIVAAAGFMQDMVKAPRSQPNWDVNNPQTAVREFLVTNDEFELVQPPWLFNESEGLHSNVTHWPGARLRRKSSGASFPRLS